jgi:hypothetical protein
MKEHKAKVSNAPSNLLNINLCMNEIQRFQEISGTTGLTLKK